MGLTDKVRTALRLATPEKGGSGFGRAILAGTSAVAIAGATAVALGGLAALMAALLAIYLIATRILGLQVELDPQALYEKFSQYARQ